MDVNTGLQQLRESGETWDAVQDELLLRVLQSLRDGILRRAEHVEKHLQDTSQHANAVGLKLRAANCHLEVLAQSQFLEHRIQAEEGEVDQIPRSTEDLWCSSDVEPIPEVEFEAIKKALMLGQSFIQTQEQEEMPPLPPVIGSQDWHNSFITPVEDFLGETTATDAEIPAEAAEEVQESADGAEAPWPETMEAEAEDPGTAATVARPPLGEMNLAGQLSALLTRRGGPIEGDGEDDDQAAQAPPAAPVAKAKGKGKGKTKKTGTESGGSLFDDPLAGAKKTQVSSPSPAASLFDDEPRQVTASPAKTSSSLFDDGPSSASPPGGSFFDDEPLPKPKAKAPIAKTLPGPLTQASPGKSGVSLFDDEPVPKAAAAKIAPQVSPPVKSFFDDDPPLPKASSGKSGVSLFDDEPMSVPQATAAKAAPQGSKNLGIAASLFDDEPAKKPIPVAKTTQASSLFGDEDPLFSDAKGKGKGKAKTGTMSGGGFFDDPLAGAKKTQASSPSPAAALFDEEPRQAAASPKSGLFGDGPSSAPISKTLPGPLTQASAGKSGPPLLDHEPAPVAKTLPGPLTQASAGKSGLPFAEEEPVPKSAPEKAVPEQGSKNIPAAASLFNEKPVGLFGDKPVRDKPASSLLGLFGDEDPAPVAKTVPGPLTQASAGKSGLPFADEEPVPKSAPEKAVPEQGSKNIPAAASLFNEKPVGLFGDKPASSLLGLFGDEDPAPVAKTVPGPLTQASAGKSGLPFAEEEPVPKSAPEKAVPEQGSKNIPAAASLFNEKPVGLFGDKPASSLLGLFGDEDPAPVAKKTVPGPLTQASAGKSGLPFAEDEPVPKSAPEKAVPEQVSKNLGFAASLFDDKPVRLFDDMPAKGAIPVATAKASSLLFADEAPVPKTFPPPLTQASAGKSRPPLLDHEPVLQPTPVEAAPQVSKNLGFAASLFDDKPVRLFEDTPARKASPIEKAAQAPMAKTLPGPLTQASAKSGLSMLDEPAPIPKMLPDPLTQVPQATPEAVPQQAPIPKMLPDPLTQVPQATPVDAVPQQAPIPKMLPDPLTQVPQAPVEAVPQQASKKLGIGSSLFDDKPARLFSDKPASSLLGLFGDDDEDPLFNDAPGVAKASAPS